MADNRKEQERDELHRTIWGIANDLRGSVDGWDFKQYVLGMLFYRYISENFANYINDGEREAGDATFDYAQLSDSDAEQARDDLIKTKGFFILPSQLFCSVRSRAPLDENLNETLEAVFQAIEDSAKGSDSEANFSGLFDDIDVNSNKLGGTVAERNKRLVKLMNGVGDMKLGDYRDNTIDAFGLKVNAPQLADTHLNQLRALDFVIQELSLYLDTHPNDSEAFALFQNYVELEKTAREKYVEQHGPLTQNDAALSSTYTWVNGPWPWQYPEEEV